MRRFEPSTLIAFALVIAALQFGKEILLPFAMAVFLSFRAIKGATNGSLDKASEALQDISEELAQESPSTETESLDKSTPTVPSDAEPGR